MLIKTKAFTFLREFVLGSNPKGLVTGSGSTVSVVGGESSSLAAAVLPGGAGIYYGAGTTQSTYIYPTATVAAWNSFIATAAPSGDIAVITGTGKPSSSSSSSSAISSGLQTVTVPVTIALAFWAFLCWFV